MEPGLWRSSIQNVERGAVAYLAQILENCILARPASVHSWRDILRYRYMGCRGNKHPTAEKKSAGQKREGARCGDHERDGDIPLPSKCFRPSREAPRFLLEGGIFRVLRPYPVG